MDIPTTAITMNSIGSLHILDLKKALIVCLLDAIDVKVRMQLSWI